MAVIDNYMKQLEKELALEEPFEASSGIYEYLLREDLPILIAPLKPEGVMLSARIGAAPPEAGDAFYAHMLNGNLYGGMTYGAVLGLEADGKQMVLSKVADRHLNYNDFRLILDDFINVVIFWREEAGIKDG